MGGGNRALVRTVEKNEGLGVLVVGLGGDVDLDRGAVAVQWQGR